MSGPETGKGFVRFNIVANSKRSFLVSSPACSDDVVVDGGAVRMVIISVAACVKKSSILTSGKGIDFGKNVTVSTSLSLQVLEKKHFVHPQHSKDGPMYHPCSPCSCQLLCMLGFV